MTTPEPSDKSAQYAALYQACVSEAVSRSRMMMDQLVTRTRQSLYHGAGMGNDASARNAPTEALRLLNKHEAELRDGFAAALLASFSEAVTQVDKPRAATLEAPSFDQLELMDESQVQESVEVARALQAAQLAVEAELSELNGLVCTVQGLKTVQPERNPFRPEVYVRTLRAVLTQTGVAPAVRLRWMQHMGMALGQELGPVYRELAAMMRVQGVAPAGYSVIQAPDALAAKTAASPGAASSAKAAAAAAGGSAAEAAEAGDSVLLTVDQLRRLLAGELDRAPAGIGAGGAGAAVAPGEAESFAQRFAREFEQTPRAAPPSEFQPTVPAAFETLREMKQVDKVVERIARRKAAAAAEPPGAAHAAAPMSTRERMRRDARGVGQSLGLEVVNLMVDNIANDPRLLAPVQQAVRDVEPALLRLALIDPRFFSDRQHPARRLLEQLTERSLGWEDVDAPGFAAFMEPLRQAVDLLAAAPVEGPDVFAFALKSLEEAWTEQAKQERRRKEKAMKALLHAEQRHLLAEKIAAQMRNRPDARLAPAVVLNFLCSAWAQVMAEAKLGDKSGSSDPHGYGALIDDVVWSSMPELARSNTARLTQMVGPLLQRLRSGLKKIDYPAVRTNAFFDELMALHKQALKAPGAAGAPAAPRPREEPLSLDIISELQPEARPTRAQLEAQFQAADDAMWVAPAEAQQSGFMDTVDPLARPAFENTKPGFRATQPQAAETKIEDVLTTGAWVEIEAQGKRTRSQLTWASPHGSLFMFTAASGSTCSMTRKTLDQLLSAGHMRVIAQHEHAVVAQALDGVAKTAMRNSVDSTI